MPDSFARLLLCYALFCIFTQYPDHIRIISRLRAEQAYLDHLSTYLTTNLLVTICCA